MSKIIFLSVLFFVTGLNAMSQCDKKVAWHASKVDMFDAKGSFLQTKEATIIVETDPKKVTLSFKESSEDGLEGTVTEKVCDWKKAFADGKTVYHATVFVDGRTSNATFTVEAKDGKVTVSADIEMMEGRKFVVYVNTYEEVK